MTTRYESDIYLFLSLYRFFAYGLAVTLIQVVRLDTASEPSFSTYALLSLVGMYTLLKTLGPLRWWRQDHMTFVVLGGDVLVCVLILLPTGGLDSPYLLYSFSPVVAATLLFQEKMALAGAAIFSMAITVAHITPAWTSSEYTWVMSDNYLLWLMLYITAIFVIATSVYRANLNIRRRIESEVVDDERRRMQGEMNDGLAQNLVNLSTKIDAVGELIGQERSSEAQAALCRRSVLLPRAPLTRPGIPLTSSPSSHFPLSQL